MIIINEFVVFYISGRRTVARAELQLNINDKLCKYHSYKNFIIFVKRSREEREIDR